MLDPLPLRSPPWLQNLALPISTYLSTPTLPPHIHQVVFAFGLYQFTFVYLSPVLSTLLFPNSYPRLSRRTRINWDVHVVSLVQSLLVCALAAYVMVYDTERMAMGWRERVYGYTGALGLNQAFGCGYFLWDLYVCVRYFSMFGPGMLAHAVSALAVYSFGFRPFLNFYAPNFVLYELSSPFLNVHWFCDKLDLTGSTIQLINGIFLLATFFGCRLVWGTYASLRAASDVFKALALARSAPFEPPLAHSVFAWDATAKTFASPLAALQVVQYAPETPEVPTWLWVSFAASNVTLNALNWFWFEKMIGTIRKRFDPPLGTRTAAAAAGDGNGKATETVAVDVDVAQRVDGRGRKMLEVDEVEVRRRVPQTLAEDDMPPLA